MGEAFQSGWSLDKTAFKGTVRALPSKDQDSVAGE